MIRIDHVISFAPALQAWLDNLPLGAASINRLNQLEKAQMAINESVNALAAKLDAVAAAVAKEKAEVAAKVAALKADIEALKTQIANGDAVTAAALDQLGVKVDALVPAVDDISNDAPAAPPADPNVP